MSLLPSIYDLNADALGAYDFSRPLFVQASRPAHFTEVLEVVHQRLSLPRDNSSLLTAPTYPQRPWEAATHIVRTDARLSEHTMALTPGLRSRDFSVVVITTTVPFGNRYDVMRYQSNLACFCHAIEPVPVLMISGEGQMLSGRQLFQVVERRVDDVRLTGNIQISEQETEALFNAALHRVDGHVVEVGRFSGGTAMVLAAAGRKSGRPGLISIDNERLPAVDYFFRVNGLSDDIQLLDGDSGALAEQWPTLHQDPRIGMLFIDADHSYDAVTRDLAAWTPYLSEGGTLVMHDLGSPDCGVSRAAYYLVMNSPQFVNARQVNSMLFCERAAGVAPDATRASLERELALRP